MKKDGKIYFTTRDYSVMLRNDKMIFDSNICAQKNYAMLEVC